MKPVHKLLVLTKTLANMQLAYIILPFNSIRSCRSWLLHLTLEKGVINQHRLNGSSVVNAILLSYILCIHIARQARRSRIK